MKRIHACCLALCAVMLGACEPGVDLEAERAALRAASDAYHAAGEAKSAEEFSAAYASGSRILPPGDAEVIGPSAARAFFAEFAAMPEASLEFSDVTVEVAAGGDMGYTLGDVVVTFENEEGEVVEITERDFHLWRKQDGEWKIAVDIWNEGPSPVMAGEDAGEAPSGPLAGALAAAWPGMKDGATVMDWEGNVLREGSNGYTCMPTPPNLTGTAPMCFNDEWMEFGDAWQNETEYEADSLGISYMLAGDEGASNIDPYAEEPTEDNEWIREGPHLMILAPPELLADYPTDPDNGGPYVMWAGTPYQHLMVPVGSRDD